MHWNFYVGTEKTGSSHLQSRLALSRDILINQGVAFPSAWAHDERCMRNGQISAGNARLLAKALKAKDEHAAHKELTSAVRFAQRSGADQVVLASEWLLSALAGPGQVERLLGLLEGVGAESVSMLLVLRDPLDQCLSLYKHRAKRGTAGDIETWVQRGYQLPEHLAGFRQQLETTGVDLQVRRYQRAQGALDHMFFEGWLGVSVPGVDMPKSVNPSLTLAELVLVRQVAQTRPELVGPLFDALAVVDPGEKVQGSAMETYARAVATRAVAAHADEWIIWNERLPEDERLEIPANLVALPPTPRELGLSDRQMQAIGALFAEAATLPFLARVLWQSRLRPALGRLKRAVWR